MSYFVIFKRFEIWLLLGIVVALIVFAFRHEQDAPPQKEIVAAETGEGGATDEAESAAHPESSTRLSLSKVEVEDTQQGQIVELTLLARSEGDESVLVSEETLVATTESGATVPRFFAPFQPEQWVSSAAASPVTVRLWLADPVDAIWLDFQNQRVRAELPAAESLSES